uniref:Uncharacterized protein n=1 Tax=Anguilla anguilla TaxID=7936 RepID=A0A0E9THK9_ANGAN
MNQTELRKTWNWNGLSCRTKSQKHYAQVQRLYHSSTTMRHNSAASSCQSSTRHLF